MAARPATTPMIIMPVLEKSNHSMIAPPYGEENPFPVTGPGAVRAYPINMVPGLDIVKPCKGNCLILN